MSLEEELRNLVTASDKYRKLEDIIMYWHERVCDDKFVFDAREAFDQIMDKLFCGVEEEEEQ